MINKNIKIVLAAVLFGMAIWQFSENYIGNGIFLLILVALVVLLYFKNELLIAVLFKFRKQDMEGAAKTLAKLNPDTHLVRNQKGYFYYLHGILAAQSSNIKASEDYFKKAIEFGLNQKEDLAVAKLQLAGVSLSKNRQLEAQKLLSEAEQLDSKGILKEQIMMMKTQMKKVKGQKIPMWYNQAKKRGF